MIEDTHNLNFTITEGNPEEYWNQYNEFIQLYNKGNIKVTEIMEKLGLSQSKYRKYRKKAINENKLKIRKTTRNYRKNSHHKTSTIKKLTEKQDKIYKYIEATWYEMHCKDKKDVRKIIAREILAHPEMDFNTLYLHCKRKCIAEL